jgi:hypothetical protein
MTDLPRPTVDVTSREDGGHKVDVTISRGSIEKKYEGGKTGGFSRDGAFKEAVEQILADPHTAEWLPPVKRG